MMRVRSFGLADVLGSVLLGAVLSTVPTAVAQTAQTAPAAKQAPANKEIAAAAAKWAAIFVDDNPDAILSLYDDGAVLWGTLSPKLLVGKPELRGYFERAYKALPGHKVAFGEQVIRVYGDVAVNSGYYTFSYVKEGRRRPSPRVTASSIASAAGTG